MTEHTIEIQDKYSKKCLDDSIGSPKKTDSRKPEGFVKVFEIKDDGEKQLVAKSNLVVYQGREWIMERVFNVNNANTTMAQSSALYWFGIGSGGTVTLGDHFNPVAPDPTDTGLNPDSVQFADELMITDTSTRSGDLRAAEYFKRLFDSPGGLVYQVDTDNDSKYLIAKIQVTLASGDANGSGSQIINEAGLFLAPTENSNETDFHLFSRVTFNAIVKDSSRQLVFIWYIYF